MTEPAENKSPQPSPHHSGGEKSGHGVLIAIIVLVAATAAVIALTVYSLGLR